MSENERKPATRHSLRDFDAYADRNGAVYGEDDALDVGEARRTRHDMTSDPSGPAQTARTASDGDRIDAIEGGTVETSDATAAETPPETLRHLGDASTTPAAPSEPPAKPSGAAREAIERATAAVGTDEE